MAQNAPNKIIKLPVALACYAFLLKPRPSDDPTKEPQYSVSLLWPKKALKDGTLKELTDAIQKAAVAKFGPNALKDLQSGRLKGWPRDGDTSYPEKKEYAGQVFINARNTRKPSVIDNRLQPVMSADDVYSGCKVRAAIQVFAYDSKGNKGVSFSLQGLMVTEKGEHLDNAVDAADLFKEYAGTGTEGATDDENPLD